MKTRTQREARKTTRRERDYEKKARIGGTCDKSGRKRGAYTARREGRIRQGTRRKVDYEKKGRREGGEKGGEELQKGS